MEIVNENTYNYFYSDTRSVTFTRMMMNTFSIFYLPFFVKEIVHALHALVSLVNGHLPYNAVSLYAIKDYLKSAIGYRETSISVLEVKLNLRVKYNFILN